MLGVHTAGSQASHAGPQTSSPLSVLVKGKEDAFIGHERCTDGYVNSTGSVHGTLCCQAGGMQSCRHQPLAWHQGDSGRPAAEHACLPALAMAHLRM